VLAVLGFVGFESAAALGAEARDPHRAIPRAVLTSAVIVGVLYVFAAYASVLGLGTAGLGNSAAPMDDLGQAVGLSGFRYVIDLGVTASFFAVTIASINAASRVLFAVSHEGVLHAALRRTHARHRTPHVAILALLPPVVLVPAIMILVGVTPLEVYAYTGTIGTFGYLTAYFLMALGMPIFLRRHHTVRAYHWVLSAAAVLSILYVVYKNLVPVPDYPYNILPYVYLALLIIGLAWYAVVRARGRGGTEQVDLSARELKAD
jgi:amino acid transporter